MGKSLDLREVLGADGDSVIGVKVTGISADSRRVKPGDVFFALAGSKTDGRGFLTEAAARGAVALVAEGVQPDGVAANIAYIKVRDARAALARAAAKFYPRAPATIVAITGTNGKTSVASFVRQIWARLGQPAASVGTVGLVTPSGETPGNLTTPDPIVLHELVDKLAGEGVTHLAMEASSHGLEQRRLDGVRLAAGAFTNLTRDHLDYHHTLEAYRAAKLRLFDTLLPAGAAAVVDTDQPEALALVDIARRRKLRFFGVGRAGADLTLLHSTREGFAQLLRIEAAGLEHRVMLPLVGGFQVSNALMAAGLAIATGSEVGDVLAALEGLKGASGRLERVGEKSGAPVFVDYAHTPDALANALAALRPYASGKLIVVFGAGGDRDAGKRPLMGAAAAAGADRLIVTDDNPRSEDPAMIRRAILGAAPGAVEIGDRAEAIKTAVNELKRGDVLLVAGKGHETGQIVGDRTLPFSDQAAVRAALGKSA